MNMASCRYFQSSVLCFDCIGTRQKTVGVIDREREWEYGPSNCETRTNKSWCPVDERGENCWQHHSYLLFLECSRPWIKVWWKIYKLFPSDLFLFHVRFLPQNCLFVSLPPLLHNPPASLFPIFLVFYCCLCVYALWGSLCVCVLFCISFSLSIDLFFILSISGSPSLIPSCHSVCVSFCLYGCLSISLSDLSLSLSLCLQLFYGAWASLQWRLCVLRWWLAILFCITSGYWRSTEAGES